VSEPASVLIIEDEPHMRTLLHVTLKQEGYRCIQATNGEEGVSQALRGGPNVILLDLGLPDVDGLDVTTRIREKSTVPIIVISARGQEEHKISALDTGANDYITKPFSTGELLARVRVALRSSPPPLEETESGTIRVGDLVMDFDMRRVTVAGAEVHLTPTEYRLLGLLMRSGGRVLTHRQILRQVWGPGYEAQVQYLRVYMKKLRYKIESQPAQPKYLINEPGVGYRLRLPS
jgi:two-component system, OmpR family, KDP operon response regulator KdpE